MMSRGRFARWAGAQSNSDLCKYGVLLVLAGAYPYWMARSRGFWQDASDEFWSPLLVVVATLPLVSAAIGGVLGWRRGRGSGKAGGLAVFFGGWWFAVTAIIVAVLRVVALLALVIAFRAEQ